ncbi:Metallo-dependent hydrolase, partial [Mesorhizobium alhagi CCNWXJ12-2]
MDDKSFKLRELVRVVARAVSRASAVFSPARAAFTMLRPDRKMLAAAIVLGLCATASADNILFENVRIFDGKGAALSAPSNVLVQGNVIARISIDPIEAEGAERIAGNGRTLMPGLIDAHWHAMLIATGPAEAMGDIGFATLAAGDEATDTLMRGFTTVRDVGGPAFGLTRAIDQGIIEGPRIYPSGAMMTVTSGHGDFRQMSDLP